MALPKRINPCPIIESVIEIRVKTDMPPSALFGILHNALKDEYKEIKELPIMQIPSQIRLNDPNLKYAPYYQLISDDYIVQVGARVISLINPKAKDEYIGWDNIFEKIQHLLATVKGLEIVTEAERVGVRYINYFNNDVFNKIKLKVDVPDSILSKKLETTTRLVLQNNDRLKASVSIANNATLNIAGAKTKGSIIDIDAFQEDNLDIFDTSTFIQTIADAHTYEKEIFFNILNEDFLKDLNPEY